MSGSAAKFGVFAMEYLVNAILKHGGRKANFEIKLFGGANVLATGMDVGDTNIAFIRDYMRMEGLNISSEDLGGIHPRKVNYFPLTGKVMIKNLRPVQEKMVAERERTYAAATRAKPSGGEVELF